MAQILLFSKNAWSSISTGKIYALGSYANSYNYRNPAWLFHSGGRELCFSWCTGRNSDGNGIY